MRLFRNSISSTFYVCLEFAAAGSDNFVWNRLFLVFSSAQIAQQILRINSRLTRIDLIEKPRQWDLSERWPVRYVKIAHSQKKITPKFTFRVRMSFISHFTYFYPRRSILDSTQSRAEERSQKCEMSGRRASWKESLPMIWCWWWPYRFYILSSSTLLLRIYSIYKFTSSLLAHTRSRVGF